MASTTSNSDDHYDNAADLEIERCLASDTPASFFLLAGAGSGKTRSLVEALKGLSEKRRHNIRINGQRVAVITYTKTARDEVNERILFDPLVEVSTIHHFIWGLINKLHSDIRIWLRTRLEKDIAELESKQSKGRSGKMSDERARDIENKRRRITSLPNIKKFTYNPDGENWERDSLNHSEVIQIGADFLSTKPMMQRLLISRFPIVLIDECQDTNRLLMEALLTVQKIHAGHFLIGLFGDMMQRIYGDGKADLVESLPPEWVTPSKRMNHRSPKRVVELINRIRSAVDDHKQKARSDSAKGTVRLFVLPNTTQDKAQAEKDIRIHMKSLTKDPLWNQPESEVKTLILEHRMAARRMGFLEMFESLQKIDKFRTGLLDGSLPEIRLFSSLVFPLVNAQLSGDKFATAAIVRKSSPLMSKRAFRTSNDQREPIQKTRNAVQNLMTLWEKEGTPIFADVLESISDSNLFLIPDSLRPLTGSPHRGDEFPENPDVENQEDNVGRSNDELSALQEFLSSPFNQIESYKNYVEDLAEFTTHQGVKGLEFPRVMVIADDLDAKGFLFSYDKLFGSKEKSKTDLENEIARKETGIDRTRRLFYVTCSRAQSSLAIVAYSENPQQVEKCLVEEGWFTENEIEVWLH